jgi:hypothetical protein
MALVLPILYPGGGSSDPCCPGRRLPGSRDGYALQRRQWHMPGVLTGGPMTRTAVLLAGLALTLSPAAASQAQQHNVAPAGWMSLFNGKDPKAGRFRWATTATGRSCSMRVWASSTTTRAASPKATRTSGRRAPSRTSRRVSTGASRKRHIAAGGPLRLQHIGGPKGPDGNYTGIPSLVQFRNIFVKELP